MPIDDNTFQAKFEARKKSYTGDHVKEQLQKAYTAGNNDLYNALKEVFMKEKMYEACAVLRNHKII